MNRRHKARRLKNRRGSVILIVTGSILAMFGFGIFLVDAGSVYRQRRIAQTAADAAALAGGSEVMRAQDGRVEGSARDASGTNGFAHGDRNINVAVSHPPITGFYVDDYRFVEVVITRRMGTLAMRIFGIDSVTIRARAVAGAGGKGLSCVYVLEPTAAAAYHGGSNSRLEASCGVTINSRHSDALDMESSSQLIAGQIAITGGYDADGGTVISPTPVTGLPAAPDPLGYLDPPANAAGACDFTDLTLDTGGSPHTLYPGVYCGGLTLKGDAVVNLEPGMYVLRGANPSTKVALNLQGNSQLNGAGVTFYLTTGPSRPYGPIKTESNGVMNLSAPEGESDYAGILFFQDRSIPASTGSSGDWPIGSGGYVHRFESSSTSTLTGTLYFPTQTLRFESNIVINGDYTNIISRVLLMESSSRVNVNNDYTAVVNPIKRLTLVE